jgi:hypothetical protein
MNVVGKVYMYQCSVEIIHALHLISGLVPQICRQ